MLGISIIYLHDDGGHASVARRARAGRLSRQVRAERTNNATDMGDTYDYA
jgi:hypothetical protein